MDFHFLPPKALKQDYLWRLWLTGSRTYQAIDIFITRKVMHNGRPLRPQAEDGLHRRHSAHGRLFWQGCM